MSAIQGDKHIRLFISAGETSGDLHASNLIRQLRSLAPSIECAGLGGDAMETAGARILHNMLGEFAVMGFADAFRVLPAIKHLRDETLTHLDVWRPDAAVLVDYPGFHLNLALHLKRRGIPVFYYICPQMWAWAPWRVRKMARRVDRAFAILPFEEEWFRQRGVKATYVGHPLGDVFAQRKLDEEFLAKPEIGGAQSLVALLPGSRSKEIEAGLPVKVAAARMMKATAPQLTFAIPVTTQRHAEEARRIAAEGGLEAGVYVAKTYEVMSRARFALATSGTATLELAHFGVPMVVLYRTNPAGLVLKRALLTTRHISLVNIIAGREVVPELVYWRNSAEKIARMAMEIMQDPARHEQVKRDVRAVGEMIEAPGASERVAREILRALGKASEKVNHRGTETQ